MLWTTRSIFACCSFVRHWSILAKTKPFSLIHVLICHNQPVKESPVMVYMSEKRYEAIRFYLESVNNGKNAHTIDWGNPAFSAFTTLEQYTKDDFSFEDGSTQAYKKRRGNFILSAKTFLLQPSHRYILHHNGKPVPRPSQYGDILRELHNQRGHTGMTKMIQMVSSTSFFSCQNKFYVKLKGVQIQ